jgi:plasmid stability protein
MAMMAEKPTAKRVGRDSDQFIVRLPDGMRKHLARIAERNGRSMNAEIVAALAIYFENEDAAKQDQLLGVETAIRELADNQQQTVELLKKIILSPIAPKKWSCSAALRLMGVQQNGRMVLPFPSPSFPISASPKRPVAATLRTIVATNGSMNLLYGSAFSALAICARRLSKQKPAGIERRVSGFSRRGQGLK